MEPTILCHRYYCALQNSKVLLLMERVGTLLQKLQKQLEQQAGAADMLLTVQQLQAELHHVQASTSGGASPAASKVMVDVPSVHQPVPLPADPVPVSIVFEVPPEPEPVAEAQPMAEPTPMPVLAEEKIVEVLQVDEAALEAELEEIKRNAAAKNSLSVHYRPVVEEEQPEELPPTLAAHQPPPAKELNDTIAQIAANAPSLNDQLKQTRMELGEQLAEPPIRDLRKAIGINDRYLFINELFRGDETMYERSIKTINAFTILPEAEYWIQRELKVKLGWIDSNETVKQFNQLIKRRFS
jgi:hypothetical protein